MKVNTFKEDKKVGKIGEAIAINLLEGKYSKEVIDVSEETIWQKIDVDLIADDITIEVKTDTSRTPNIFFETVSNIQLRTPGCMLYTEADILFYVHLGHKFVITVNVDKYRDWVLKNKEQFREVSVRTSNAIGLLIPIRQLIEEVNNVGMMDLKGNNLTRKQLLGKVW